MRGGILRLGLIVAAAGLGILLLTQGFGNAGTGTIIVVSDGDDGNEPDGGDNPTPSQSATSTPSPDETPEVECAPKGVRVAVFNASETDGLAALAAERLEKKGYVFPTDAFIETAPATSPQTIVYFRAADDRTEAQCLARALKVSPQITKLPSGANYVPEQAQLAVLLGSDYAARNPVTETG